VSGKIQIKEDKYLPSGSIIYYSQPRNNYKGTSLVKIYCGNCHQTHYTQVTPLKKTKTAYCLRCSLSLQNPSGSGPRNPRWLGGTKCHPEGYLSIHLDTLSPDEKILFAPMLRKDQYILEHRVVMARHLGRPLLSSEVIHHLNGIKDDNRLENLFLCTDNTDHKKQNSLTLSFYQNEILRLQKEVTRLQDALKHHP
jgi:hypothetical protein